MANYTPQDAYNLLKNDQQRKTDIANVGQPNGDLFLSWCAEFKKHFFIEARKADPTLFQSITSANISKASNELTISDLETLNGRGCGIFEADSDGNITNEPLAFGRRGAQERSWWFDSLNRKVVFEAQPEVARKYFVVYMTRQAKPSAVDSDLLVPENNDEFVLMWFRRRYDIWNQNLTLNLNDTLLKNAMDRIIDNLNPFVPGELATNRTVY
jgi:hypothetical protein